MWTLEGGTEKILDFQCLIITNYKLYIVATYQPGSKELLKDATELKHYGKCSTNFSQVFSNKHLNEAWSTESEKKEFK